MVNQLQMALGPLLLQTGGVPFQAGALPLPENPGAAGHQDEQQGSQQPRDNRVAATPDDDAFAHPYRAGADRLAGTEAPQIVRQLQGGGITAAGFLSQA